MFLTRRRFQGISPHLTIRSSRARFAVSDVPSRIARAGLTQALGAQMARPPQPPDIEAEITYLSSEAGGKKNSVRSGYRPTHDFGVEGMFNDAHHEYEVESVAPGETAMAQLWLLAPEYQVGRLFPGFRFTVHEGPHLVAHGVIVNVINQSLAVRA